MFIAPEVKGDLCLEQAEFQSMVSGEDVSIAQKYEKARSVEWKTPGILGGNEVPNWKDNSGSVLRRLLTFNFGKQVKDADPHLDEKLDAEIPVILLKCVKGYLEYSQKYSDQNIWNVVPKYFKGIQNQVAMVTNSLQNFCPQKRFITVSISVSPKSILSKCSIDTVQITTLGESSLIQISLPVHLVPGTCQYQPNQENIMVSIILIHHLS